MTNNLKRDLLIFAVAVMLAGASLYAKAEVRLGTGINCGVPAGDGIWEQEGSPYVRDDCDNAFSLQYVGQTSFRWLDYMAGLSYRKGSSITHGRLVTDDCYNHLQFSGGRVVDWHGKPENECDLRYNTRLIDTTSKGLTFALVPTYKAKDWSVYASVRVSLFKAVTKIEWDDTQGVCSYRDGGCGTQYHRFSDRSTYFDVGATYKQAFMTLYYSPNERGGEAPNSGNYGVVAGVRF